MGILVAKLSSGFVLGVALAIGIGGAVSCSATGGTHNGAGGSGAAGSGATGGSAAGGTGGIDIDAGTGGGGGTGAMSGGVPQTCAAATAAKSYIGCEYWPTATINDQLNKKFTFAIAAANPTGSDATVTVDRQGTQVAQQTVKAGGLVTIELPWVNELQIGSVLAAGAAYHVTSSVPITLYQFNPLEFELPQASCNPTDPMSCYSYTNDASLLLPESALREKHWIMSYPALHFGSKDPLGIWDWTNLPGMFSVTATQDNTTVKLTTTANVAAGPGVSAVTAGTQTSYHMNAGDVLQLTTQALPNQPIAAPGKTCTVVPDGPSTDYFCPPPSDYDFTGSLVEADKPVAVIGGHDCTFVPYDKRACDHLEESIFPVEALGQDLLVTSPQDVGSITSAPGTPAYQFVRVLSAVDNNKITFDPSAVHPDVTLNAGKWIEIGPVSGDFHIKADNKILVAQYVAGQEFLGNANAGDPAMSVAIPTEQYRLEYTFLAPSTYTYNFVNIVAPNGATIVLDGTPVAASEFHGIGQSGFRVARHKIDGGVHNITGDKNFGIVVYGYASYTSYMYPGGLNLDTIVIQPK